jgi:hypothetical protein
MACLSASGHYIPRFVVIRGLGYKDSAVLKLICHLGQKQYFGRMPRWNGDRLLIFFIFNCREALWSSMGTDRISRTCQHKRRHYETMSYCCSSYRTAPTDSSHWMCHVSVYWKRSTMMLQKICLKNPGKCPNNVAHGGILQKLAIVQYYRKVTTLIGKSFLNFLDILLQWSLLVFGGQGEKCSYFPPLENSQRTIFSLLSKNESRLIKSPGCLSVCVSVCHPLITFEPLCRFSWYLVWR